MLEIVPSLTTCLIFAPPLQRLLDLLPRFLQETASANGPCADAWRVAIATLMPAMRDEFTRM